MYSTLRTFLAWLSIDSFDTPRPGETIVGEDRSSLIIHSDETSTPRVSLATASSCRGELTKLSLSVCLCIITKCSSWPWTSSNANITLNEIDSVYLIITGRTNRWARERHYRSLGLTSPCIMSKLFPSSITENSESSVPFTRRNPNSSMAITVTLLSVPLSCTRICWPLCNQ